MNRFLTVAAAALFATGAQAQSIPDGFELSGNLDYGFYFNTLGSASIGYGDLELGYRHEISADMAIGGGVTGVFGFGSIPASADFGFYAYVDYRNFRLSYGRIDNAVSHFDWEFVIGVATILDYYPVITPLGLHSNYETLDDVLRVDADFGNYQVSASYISSLDVFALAAQTQLGNTRVLASYERNMGGINELATLGVHHEFGDFELGAVVSYMWGLAPFEFMTRFSATYHVNDQLSVKALYVPDLFIVPTHLLEIVAIYEVNDRFGLSASVIDGPIGLGTAYSIDAHFRF